MTPVLKGSKRVTRDRSGGESAASDEERPQDGAQDASAD